MRGLARGSEEVISLFHIKPSIFSVIAQGVVEKLSGTD